MHLIDSHAHLNAAEFKPEWENIVASAKNAGLSHIINIGADPSDSEWGIEQANQEPIVYATAGIHPEYLSGQPLDWEQLINNLRRLLISSPKVVAIGEIGLDFTLDPNQAPVDQQIELFKAQLNLATELNLPVVLHVRDQKGQTTCFNTLLKILQQFTTLKSKSNLSTASSNFQQFTTINPPTGVFHCWTGTPEQVQQALALGFYISFSGILTYPTAGHIIDAAKIVPDDKILIETDAPYLTPEPQRALNRQSRQKNLSNQPKYVIMTARKLADLRQTTLNHTAELTTSNAIRLFGLSRIGS